MKFDELRSRWLASLTGERNASADVYARKIRREMRDEALTHWRSMNRNPGRLELWTDLQDPGNPYVRDRICLASYRRLELLAKVWYLENGLPVDYLTDVLAAMQFLYQNWYNERDRKGGEWWHREIGIPLSLTRCVLFLYDALTDEDRSDYLRVVQSYVQNPDWMCIEDIPEISTGANRVWKCLALVQCGILKQDEQLMWTASDKIRDVFRFSEQGDGFYRDGSFVQHGKFAYTGGYGISFLESVVSYLELTADTPWCLQQRELEILLEWIQNGYLPLMFRGGFMSLARGREIAREDAQEHHIGHQLISALVKLCKVLPEQRALPIQATIKRWIGEDTYRDYLRDVPIALQGDVRHILDDPAVVPSEAAEESRIFAGMDKAVHHRKHFSAAISMCSSRTGRYESIHGENVKGWYTSEGMLYLYNSDLGQFSDDYFATVNAYRMPGTTVDVLEREAIGIGFGQEPPVQTAWAGGSVLQNRYGSVGMELKAERSDLKGKKSWFLFDVEIVCLGAGISSAEGRRIETVVENRKIHGPLSEVIRRGTVSAGNCNTEWFHLRGPVPGSDVGYILPWIQNVELSEEIREGSWHEINLLSGSARRISQKYGNLVLHHGRNPQNGTYGYILLPGKNPEETERYAASPEVVILANTDEVQAVRHTGLGLTGVNFWTDGSCEADGIKCDKKASVMLRRSGERMELSVSDPTWENREGIHLIIDQAADCVVSCDPEIQVTQLRPDIRLTVQTVNTLGRSLSVIFG